MSETKRKYFIVDFEVKEAHECKTLPEALKVLNNWLKDGDVSEKVEKQIRDKEIILIKGTKLELEAETEMVKQFSAKVLS